jgi:hypothetical protein
LLIEVIRHKVDPGVFEFAKRALPVLVPVAAVVPIAFVPQAAIAPDVRREGAGRGQQRLVSPPTVPPATIRPTTVVATPPVVMRPPVVMTPPPVVMTPVSRTF